MARATGIGSMPGDDFAESMRVVLGTCEQLAFVPELPARGAHAGMIGRTVALLDGLEADLQPGGWRVGVGQGVDQRRAISLLNQDLDVAEELTQGFDGQIKVQVTGPLTLAAMVERPRGDKMLADHGARRDLAQSLAAGVANHVSAVARRFSQASIAVQVDEPAITAVMSGQISTASGWGRHRSVHPPEADELLRGVIEAISAGGATPVVHSCAPDVPVKLLADAGFKAISFDRSLARPADEWAAAFEAGVDLWMGALASTGENRPSEKAARARVDEFFGRLGFSEESYRDRLVVTPSCGLAGASQVYSRAVLTSAAAVSGSY
jgi:methionine synthase II (cobalamin-independent)